MELKSKLIRNRLHLHENFLAREMMESIEKYPKGYRNFVEKDLKCEKIVDTTILELLDKKLKISVDSKTIQMILKESSMDVYPDFWTENADKIQNLIKKELESEEIGSWFYLLMFIHIQAKQPLTEIEYMQRSLEEKVEKMYAKIQSEGKKSGKVIILKDGKPLLLPFSEKAAENDVCQIVNDGYLPVQVRISKTEEMRVLFHGEILYAVKNKEGYQRFLPRLTQEEQEYGRICMLRGVCEASANREVLNYKIKENVIYRIGEEETKELVHEKFPITEYSIYGNVLYYRTIESPKVKQVIMREE